MPSIRQEVVYRTSKQVDEGTMGFHDYVTHWEDFEVFTNRVSEKANEIAKDRSIVVLNISYPSDMVAVITYMKKETRI